MTGDIARYVEDLDVGETVDCGSVDVTETEMVEFASRYDPQPIHLDPEQASESMFGDLIASGWLTCTLAMRLFVLGYVDDVAALGGSGMDEIRWRAPVYAGDTLSVTAELVEKTGAGRPKHETVRIALTGTNQDDTVVLTMDALVIVERRHERG